MKVCALPALLLLLIINTTAARAPKDPQLVDMVTRMARIGRASSPSFSPDGKRMAFASDSSGIPQVWIAPIEDGAPTQVTKGNDPIGRVRWSPNGDWLVFSLEAFEKDGVQPKGCSM